MIRVTRESPIWVRPGGGTASRSSGVGAWLGVGAPSRAAARRIMRTSSSTERPLRAARSRRASLMASSSLRMVRLANHSLRRAYDCNDSRHLIALQSKRSDDEKHPDKGQGDNPKRQRPPTALAAFGPPHGRDGFG